MSLRTYYLQNGALSALPYVCFFLMTFPVSFAADYLINNGQCQETLRHLGCDLSWLVLCLVVLHGMQQYPCNCGSLHHGSTKCWKIWRPNDVGSWYVPQLCWVIGCHDCDSGECCRVLVPNCHRFTHQWAGNNAVLESQFILNHNIFFSKPSQPGRGYSYWQEHSW